MTTIEMGSELFYKVAMVGMFALQTLHRMVQTTALFLAKVVNLIVPGNEAQMTVMKASGPMAKLVRPTADTLVVEDTPTQDFEIADRVYQIRLDPAVAALHLLVYKESKKVVRYMVINEPRLRGLMKGRRFDFANAVWDEKAGIAPVRDETVRLAEEMINRIGNMRYKLKPEKVPVVKTAPKIEPVAVPKPVEREKSVVALAAPAPVPTQASVPAKALVANAAQGQDLPRLNSEQFVPSNDKKVTYVGILTSASNEVVPATRNKDAYETFTARLRFETGAEMPLRGIELQRELERVGIQVGERIEITEMGRVPVTLSGGRTGSKNLYRIVRK